MKALGYLTAIVLSVLLQTFIGAFVGITLYRWFLLPIGAPSLTTGQLYGALFFVSYVRYKGADTKKDESETFGGQLVTAVIKTLAIAGLSLGTGWILHTIIY